jgi:hypothetical protein
VDDFGVGEGGAGAGTETDNLKEKEPQVEGAEKMLAPAPLLANLGKASANAYWMDLTVGPRSHSSFTQSPELICVCRCK